MATFARAEHPSPVHCLRRPSPNGRRNTTLRCSVDEGFVLVRPPLPGKKRFDPECPTRCPTTCSTRCPGSSDFLKTPGDFNDFEGQEPSGKKTNFECFRTSEPCGTFGDVRLCFAGGKGCSGAVPPANTTIEAPSTPRTPSTPKRSLSSPLPLLASAKKPPLLRALLKGSLEDVQTVLDSDPEAAHQPFWDHDVEPPLCTAIRLMCCPQIVALLLEHGALVDHADMHNRMPLQVLHSTQVRQQLDTSEEWAQIEQLLLDADADVSAIGEMIGNLYPIAAETPTDLIPGVPGLWPPMPNLGWFEEA